VIGHAAATLKIDWKRRVASVLAIDILLDSQFVQGCCCNICPGVLQGGRGNLVELSYGQVARID
jgi:hypothetical protein